MAVLSPAAPRLGTVEDACAAATIAASIRARVARAEKDAFGLREGRAHRTTDALQRLRDCSSLQDLVESGPGEACAALGFTRAVLSRLGDRYWTPLAFHATVSEGAMEGGFRAARGRRLPLRAGGIESDLARRRVPLLVSTPDSDRRVGRPFLNASGSSSYLVVPILLDDRAVGLFHLDFAGTPQAVREEDLQDAQRFVTGFEMLYERVVLADRLVAQTAEVHRLLQERARAAYGHDEARPASCPRDAPVAQGRDDSPVARLMTPREVDVLELLSRGMPNRAIALELGVTEGTVKSHTKRIYARLRVNSRAEAAAWYFRQSGAQPAGGR